MKAKKTLITGDMIAPPPSPPKAASEPKEVMNFRVPASFRYRMKRLAVERRMNLSDLMIAAVDAYGADEFK
jgi:hypothetical protein